MRSLVRGNKAAPLVLYCNGLHCGKSKRLAAEWLLEAGYTDVRRYRQECPGWRAAGGVWEIELEGLRYVVASDGTAVGDRRPRGGGVPHGLAPRRAQHPPQPGAGRQRCRRSEARERRRPAADPEDHNTRVLVVATDAAAARHVAEALAREAFHNVSYFVGTVDAARRSLEASARR